MRRLLDYTDIKNADATAAEILSVLEDGKALNVVNLDLRGKTDIAVRMIVASATSSRHATSLAESIVRYLKDNGRTTPLAEGMRTGDWVLVDADPVIVHVFREEVREYYKLERMWGSPDATTEEEAQKDAAEQPSAHAGA